MFLAFKQKVKDFFSKSDFSGRYTIDEYYGQFYAPRTLKELERILAGSRKKQMAATESITFNQVSFEETLRATIKRLGKPLYSINNESGVKGHEIVFYRFDMGDFKVTAQLHFLKKHFFLGQYFFNELGVEKFAGIKKILANKYSNGNVTDLKNSEICDASGNRIEICDDSFGLVQYIAGNKQFLENIRMELDLILQQKLQLEKVKLNTVYASL